MDRVSVPFNAWPSTERETWLLRTTVSNRLGERKKSRRSPRTFLKYQQGYACWLGFLDRRGLLDPSQAPGDRVTKDRLVEYFDEQHARDCADFTIYGRFCELRAALRILAPDTDWDWVVRPYGVSVYSVLPMQTRALLVPAAEELYVWVFKLMDGAQTSTCRTDQLLQYRDGLFMAIAISCGRRLRALSCLRIDRELIRQENGYRVEIPPELDKTRRFDGFWLPQALTEYVDKYIGVVRPALLKGKSFDELWVTNHGDRLSAKTITHRVRQWTGQEFDEAFGPHRFKHAGVTACVLHSPDEPYMATEAFRTSDPVLHGHYIQHNVAQVRALKAHASLLDKLRCRK